MWESEENKRGTSFFLTESHSPIVFFSDCSSSTLKWHTSIAAPLQCLRLSLFNPALPCGLNWLLDTVGLQCVVGGALHR